jgi:hypothetical protein
MPRFGLAKLDGHMPASGKLNSARDRMGGDITKQKNQADAKNARLI